MSLNIHDLFQIIFKIWRNKRYNLFLNKIQPGPSDVLLDIGRNAYFWLLHPQPVARIDIFNFKKIEFDESKAPNHRIKTIVGDCCNISMPDKSYDIVYSNSIIGHLGTWERQKQFASEARRIGKKLWIQEAAYECPIEPNYLTPFIHFLPHSVQRRLLRWFTVWGWLTRPSPERVNEAIEHVRLLRRSEMAELFPDCTIYTERLFGIFPKCHIAVRVE
jgi:hypothetical protein